MNTSGTCTYNLAHADFLTAFSEVKIIHLNSPTQHVWEFYKWGA